MSELGACFSLLALICFFSFSQLRYNWNWETVGGYSNFFWRGWLNTLKISVAGAGPEYFYRNGRRLGQKIGFSRVASRKPALRGACSGYAVAGADFFCLLCGSGCFSLSEIDLRLGC